MLAFPMYVGMNRRHVLGHEHLGGVPHVRGDEPELNFLSDRDLLRSPCTWG